jgi:hypothetical protein
MPHQEHAGIGEIIDGQEFPPRRTGTPANKIFCEF